MMSFIASRTPEPPKDRSIDVAVIGSGFAGLAAAIEAANEGAKRVVILEKMTAPGGNSVLNAGQLLPSDPLVRNRQVSRIVYNSL
jgi:glycine/D-amino acid oxidase-like deaminating enzyme